MEMLMERELIKSLKLHLEEQLWKAWALPVEQLSYSLPVRSNDWIVSQSRLSWEGCSICCVAKLQMLQNSEILEHYIRDGGNYTL